MTRHSMLGISLILLVSLVFMTPALAQGPCGNSVTVNVGDTLMSIAARCATTVEALLAANPALAANPNRILAGQQLLLVAPPTPVPTLPPPTPPPVVAPPAATIAVIAIFPVSGPPGTQVNVIVNGFPANDRVMVGIGIANTPVTIIQQPTLGADGAYQATIPIPPTAQAGETWVITIASETGMAGAVSYPFTVTAGVPASGAPSATLVPTTTLPPAVTPSPAAPATATPTAALAEGQFNTANVYLIALNDNGVSGTPVGCGDSAVPIPVNFEPTTAPLTAAIEALLAMNAEFNEAGFYNALSQSDLTLNGVNLVNGLATISLGGTLRQGGVCDGPRVLAQLELTALQYPTVSGVTILVNGEPFTLGEASG